MLPSCLSALPHLIDMSHAPLHALTQSLCVERIDDPSCPAIDHTLPSPAVRGAKHGDSAGERFETDGGERVEIHRRHERDVTGDIELTHLFDRLIIEEMCAIAERTE